LKSACELLGSTDPVRDIFIAIDNFDDTIADLELNRDMARELFATIRRFDREGLHCVVVGGLDNSSSDTRRRIISSRFGIALRVPELTSSFGVMRTPAVPRGRELPAGRGWLAQSGQAMLVQIANPYISGDRPLIDDAEDDAEGAIAAALDCWVERIQQQYPGGQAAWCAGQSGVGLPGKGKDAPVMSPRLVELGSLLRRAARWELQRLTAVAGAEAPLSSEIAVLEPDSWADEETLLGALRTALFTVQRAKGTPESLIEVMSRQDTNSWLRLIAAALPEE
jgi:hypothetical protein